MKKIYTSVLVILLGLTVCVSGAFAAPILYMDVEGYVPGTNEITVNISENFKLNLWISDVPALVGENNAGISNWYHDIGLDPLVEVVDVIIPWQGGNWEVDTNILKMTGYTFEDAGISGAKVDLAEITFHCIGEGVTELTQMWHFPIPENFTLVNWTALDNDMGYPENIAFDPVSVTVNQVPIPGALLLLGSGLLGLIGIRKKIKKA